MQLMLLVWPSRVCMQVLFWQTRRHMETLLALHLVFITVTCLYLIVPDLGQVVVSPRYEVGFVSSIVVANTVHPLVVALQSEVGGLGAQLPHLHHHE